MDPERSPQPATTRLDLWVEIACLGPIGRRLPAPGTWGSLVGLALAAGLIRSGAEGLIGWVTLGLALPAVWICAAAERGLGRADPGEVIIDEVVAMPLCFLAWSRLESAATPWVLFAVGFALFRLFDITKPFGIAQLQRLPGGWGVMADDLAAALAACASLHALAALGWLGGP
jgi:phosphatidylglycerophosphatase A